MCYIQTAKKWDVEGNPHWWKLDYSNSHKGLKHIVKRIKTIFNTDDFRANLCKSEFMELFNILIWELSTIDYYVKGLIRVGEDSGDLEEQRKTQIGKIKSIS